MNEQWDKDGGWITGIESQKCAGIKRTAEYVAKEWEEPVEPRHKLQEMARKAKDPKGLAYLASTIMQEPDGKKYGPHIRMQAQNNLKRCFDAAWSASSKYGAIAGIRQILEPLEVRLAEIEGAKYPKMEELGEKQVLECSVQKIRAYLAVYRANEPAWDTRKVQ
jgi:hypothetical protein